MKLKKTKDCFRNCKPFVSYEEEYITEEQIDEVMKEQGKVRKIKINRGKNGLGGKKSIGMFHIKK